MFERTEHRDEDHVDERAHKFFTYMYGGKGGYNYGWNSLKEGLRETTTINVADSSHQFCAYCGRQALPIQKDEISSFTGRSEYKTKGYLCVCKEAMDELDMVGQMEEIKKKMNKALSDCRGAMPKPNSAVVFALVEKQAKDTKKDLEFWTNKGMISQHGIERAGFKLKGPLSYGND